MKVLIIINTIIPLAACFQIARALVISKAMQSHVQAKDIRWQMAEDKVLYERAVRLYMYIVLAGNTIWFFWQLNRIVGGWIPYSTMFISVTSVLFSAILYTNAHLILMFFKGKEFKWLKPFDFLL